MQAEARTEKKTTPRDKEKMDTEKKTKTETEKKTGYLLYDFMSREMGLSGVALRVYALIYSFTRAGGDCHGSLEYIAKRTQSSKRMVQRALDLLVKREYVIKEKNSPNHPSIYVARFDPHGQNVHVKDELHSHDVHVTRSKCPCDVDMVSNNNKDNNKEYNKSNYLLTYDSQAEKERNVVSVLGREGVVRMTFHQYACLLRAVGVLPTINYIRTLEEQILRYPERRYPNHYKTVASWARQDFRLDARGESVLRDETTGGETAGGETAGRETPPLQKNNANRGGGISGGPRNVCPTVQQL